MYALYMALHITNPETERNVRKLAAITGEPIAEAVNQAALERLRLVARRQLRLVARRQDDPMMMEDLRAIVREFAALPVLDSRTADELIGYDEDGLST